MTPEWTPVLKGLKINVFWNNTKKHETKKLTLHKKEDK